MQLLAFKMKKTCTWCGAEDSGHCTNRRCRACCRAVCGPGEAVSSPGHGFFRTPELKQEAKTKGLWPYKEDQ